MSINVMSIFRSSQYYFARCENEKTNFWLSHMIDQSWEGFRVEYTKLLMWTLIQSFQGNLEANSTTGHHILNFKICQFYIIAHSFYSFCVYFGCIFTLLFTLCSSDDHFPIFKYQGCCSSRLP